MFPHHLSVEYPLLSLTLLVYTCPPALRDDEMIDQFNIQHLPHLTK